jgi:enoyl-CoA hydratase
MNYQQIIAEIKEQILYVTINRESKLNALNKEVLAELADVFQVVNQNDEVRGVLLTGAGQKAFVAGADISELQCSSRQRFGVNWTTKCF